MEDMSVDELQSSLLVHEQQMDSHVVEEQALAIMHDTHVAVRGRGPGRRCGASGHGLSRESFDKSIVECYYCDDLSHF